jgi:hypothetical protein
MNAEATDQVLRRQPFDPFEVHLTIGEVYAVRRPEPVFLAGARLLIHHPENHQLVWCSLLHVANVLVQHTAA